MSRAGAGAFTERFPELRGVVKSIKAAKAILDGEIVALDEEGLPCFSELRSKRRKCAIIYYAFDILYLDGEDLTDTLLLTLKAALKRILPRKNTGRVRYTEHVIGDGLGLFVQLERQQMEGMVAKRGESTYMSGRSRSWLKIKTSAGREEWAMVGSLFALTLAMCVYS